MPRLIFLGAPGAGKGTQAQTLALHWHIPHISTGDILRGAMKERSPLGIKAQSYVDRGELVPDQLLLDIMEERLSQSDAQSGWILDGFPRNVNQASFLEQLLQKLTQDSVRAVNLDVPDEVLVSRLLGRGRADDTEEVIRRRLEVYREQTLPLIDFYRDRQQLMSINGNQPLEKVTADLQELLAS
ncbi:MAG TPA: adenylate kinase [Leptolyngbyaceae cyanobacterium]